MKKTKSTSEAIRLLEGKRAWLIGFGKRIAIELCKRDGSTNSHVLRQTMQARGLFDGYKGGYFWMSAVFCDDGMFTWDGTYFSYRDRENNVHERTIKVWRLKDDRIQPGHVPLPCKPTEPPPQTKSTECPQLSMFAPRKDFLP
jgi:hypothetical protein